MFERIVVGYAGDRAGRDGVVLASQLAAMSGAELTVVFPYHPVFATVPASVAEERVRVELDALLEGSAVLATARWHWSNASWPIRALHELAVFEQAQLIVFGAAPERLERRHVGLMERMVHGAPCAVAVAPAGYADREPGSLRRVGVGFADTAEGHAALRLGCRLARELGAEAQIIAGCGLSPTLASYASGSSSLPRIEQEICEETKAMLERACEELDGEPVQLDVRRADPSRALVEASHQLDLLVLGSRGYGPLRHVLLGSVSAEVMHSADCPVLVLPRQVAVSREPGSSQAALAES